MFNELLAVVAPILIGAGLGYGWARSGHDYPVEFVTRAVMNIGAPCLILSSFSDTLLSAAELGAIAAASLMVLGIMFLISALLIRLLRLDVHTFLPPTLFGNVGNMGLPLCLYAFGETGLALGLTIFVTLFAIQMSLGLLLVAGRGNIRQLVRQPVIWASLIAFAMVVGDWSLPAWLKNTTSLLGGFTIPLMIITLGISLARLHVTEWRYSLLFSLLRVAGGFVIGLLVAELMGLQGVERGVLIMQSSMPVAVFNYLLALKYDRKPGEVAGMVVLSTTLAFVLMPLIVSYLLL